MMCELLIVPKRRVNILAKNFAMMLVVVPISEITGVKEFQVKEF